MPSRREFVAHGRSEDDVGEVLGADGIIYQTVEDLLQIGRDFNPNIARFDASCFDGLYVTGDISSEFLGELEGAGRGKGRSNDGGVLAGAGAGVVLQDGLEVPVE